jgi:CheY-like chemotaxis protein
MNPPLASQANGRPVVRSVLVIDDSASMRQIVEIMLGVNGWNVLSASGSEDGIAAAIADQPDAILLGVVMPASDGSEILRRLLDDERTRAIPVLPLTGHAKGPEQRRSRWARLGAAGIIAYPLRVEWS